MEILTEKQIVLPNDPSFDKVYEDIKKETILDCIYLPINEYPNLFRMLGVTDLRDKASTLFALKNEKSYVVVCVVDNPSVDKIVCDIQNDVIDVTLSSYTDCKTKTVSTLRELKNNIVMWFGGGRRCMSFRPKNSIMAIFSAAIWEQNLLKYPNQLLEMHNEYNKIKNQLDQIELIDKKIKDLRNKKNGLLKERDVDDLKADLEKCQKKIDKLKENEKIDSMKIKLDVLKAKKNNMDKSMLCVLDEIREMESELEKYQQSD